MEWAEAILRFDSPLFDAIRSPLSRLIPSAAWPGIAELNHLAAGLCNAREVPLRFIHAPATATAIEYESRIAETGEIATRENNWHDLFNALVWLSFPAAKSAISEMHAALLAERGEAEAKSRSVERDVLTLFDEGGIVIACAEPMLAERIRGFRWRELFWERRAECEAKLRCFLFGHAQFEKALDPYVGLTARAVIVPVGEVFLAASREAKMATLDHQLARWLMQKDNLRSSHHLHPFPILGVPGWFASNEVESFYDNTGYFRPGRRPCGREKEAA